MIIDFPRQEHIPQLRQLWKEAFSDPDSFLDRFFDTGFSLYRCYCIRREGQVLAALYWFDCHWQDKRLAYIYAVATAGAHRGQGLCHRLMESVHRILLQLGYSGAVLVPQEPGLRSLYAAMGYRDMGGLCRWQALAGDSSLALEPLDCKTYAALRREYLPAEGVRQEGALLRFLQTYARFYRGQDFLLCAAPEEDRLQVYELLGKPEAAPGILAALGFREGFFRAPGPEPFAMYRSLTGENSAPAYFALALD